MEKVNPKDVKLSASKNKDADKSYSPEELQEMTKKKIEKEQEDNRIATLKKLDEINDYAEKSGARIMVAFISDGKTVIGTGAGAEIEISALVKSALRANPLLHAIFADAVYSMSMEDHQKILSNMKKDANTETKKNKSRE